jgi:hypothetical protein
LVNLFMMNFSNACASSEPALHGSMSTFDYLWISLYSIRIVNICVLTFTL